MTAVSLTYEGAGRWTAANPHHRQRCEDAFGAGEVVTLSVVENGHSLPSHRHYFATINEGWRNLPESAAFEPWAHSAETLRKHALIMTGWKNEPEIFALASRADAERFAARVRARWGDYALTAIRDNSVTVLTARSQSMKAMGRKDFERSKADVLSWIAGQIGVDEPTLIAAGARA